MKKTWLGILLVSLLLLAAAANAATKDCTECLGTGHIDEVCPACNGACGDECLHCNGVGREPCYDCNGASYLTCSYCNGTAIDPKTGEACRCVRRGSPGLEKCVLCDDGYLRGISCQVCHGAKIAPCSKCEGTGIVSAECFVCYGTGKIDECRDGHLFTGAEVTYKWNNGSCTAERCCTREECTGKETETRGIYVKETDATCTEAETGHYEAVFNNPAFTKQQTETAAVGDPLGHLFGNVTYTWKGESCTAEHSCTREGCTVKETETKERKYVKDTDATCTEAETGHYEVVFENEAFVKQQTETTEVGEPLGHEFGPATYIWEEELCTAECSCTRVGCTENKMEKATGKYVKDRRATCKGAETGHYEAVFENEAFEKQVSEQFQTGEVGVHELSDDWKVVRKATTKAEGEEARICMTCGQIIVSRSLAKLPESALMNENAAYLSVDGNTVSQIVNIRDSGKKILTIMPDPAENLLENDALVLTLTRDDILSFAAEGIKAVRLVSIGELTELVISIDKLKENLEACGADKLEVLLVAVVPMDSDAEIIVPEGMTQASVMSAVTVKAYLNGEAVEIDPALFAAVKMPGTAALSNANNDMVGLFRALPEDDFTEIEAEYVFDDEANAGCWKVPVQDNGFYLMAEKAI